MGRKSTLTPEDRQYIYNLLDYRIEVYHNLLAAERERERIRTIFRSLSNAKIAAKLEVPVRAVNQISAANNLNMRGRGNYPATLRPTTEED